MPANLTDLPVELLQRIHLLALNPFLPQTSSRIFAALHSPAPSYTARYLLSLYAAFRAKDVLVRALRHPVCGVEEAVAIRRIWERRRRRRGESCDGDASGSGSAKAVADRADSADSADSDAPPPPLECSELPRRLFRSPHAPSPPIPPLLPYLFSTYPPSANSHKGYPLCRAVLQRNYPLARFLLDRGADPSLKECMAVEIAVSMRDLRMVRLLVERDVPEDAALPSPSASSSSSSTPTPTPLVNSDLPRTAKRAKLGDRIVVGTRMVEVAMKKGATDIVNYLVHEKSVMPPLQSIMDMSKTGPPKLKPRSHSRHKASRAGRMPAQGVGLGVGVAAGIAAGIGKKRRRGNGF